MPNKTGFKITDTAAGWNRADFDDVFVRKDCFLDGGLLLWGSGSEGQLGDNATANRSSPIQTTSGGTNWKSVSTNRLNTAAIKTDGTLWTWGDGFCGLLGNGDDYSSQSSPVQTISGGNNWRSVSVGSSHTGAIKTDGSLWTWGCGFYGELGNNTTPSYEPSPVQTISGGTNWRTVSAGFKHTAAIKTDGTLWLWGSGGAGRLGNCSVLDQSSPVQTISGGANWRSVSAKGEIAAAIKTDGTLWLWGIGTSGQLGNCLTANQSSPVQTVSGGTSWRSVSAGGGHTAAIKTDGTLWLWGSGLSGGLGDNATTNRSSPVQTISGGANWRSVGVGYFHTAATKTDGTLWTWGCGGIGQLGNNANTNQSSPIQTVSGGNNWRSVSAGGSHTAAIREDCW
jgi:alpha-tubulin suppressor-like RCC1 family protein